MASKKKTGNTPSAGDVIEKEFNPLNSAAGRAFLEGKLAETEAELRYGPGNTGWEDNESKRPEVEERAEFLRALIALLPN